MIARERSLSASGPGSRTMTLPAEAKRPFRRPPIYLPFKMKNGDPGPHDVPSNAHWISASVAISLYEKVRMGWPRTTAHERRALPPDPMPLHVAIQHLDTVRAIAKRQHHENRAQQDRRAIELENGRRHADQ